MEELSQELIAIIIAAITLAAIMVPGMRALRREIGELRREVVDLDRRLTAEVDGSRNESQAGLAELSAEFRAGLGELRNELRAELHAGLGELRAELGAGLGELRAELGEVRSEISGLRADVGVVRSQVSELRERMARVEGLLEGFTRSEPAFGTGPAG